MKEVLVYVVVFAEPTYSDNLLVSIVLLVFQNHVKKPNICHLFMYSPKQSLRGYVIKLRDNLIFKALLWIKKSFKSIDFDLAKQALVFNVILRSNLFEKDGLTGK